MAWTLLGRSDGTAVAHLDKNPNGRYVGAANANDGDGRKPGLVLGPVGGEPHHGGE